MKQYEQAILSISTSWRPGYKRYKNKRAYYLETEPFIKAIAGISQTGCSFVEFANAPYSLNLKIIKKLLSEHGLQASSAHNYFDEYGLDKNDTNGDNLASLDDRLRQKALDRTLRSGERILKLGGKAIVLHPGSIQEIADRTDYWKQIVKALNHGTTSISDYTKPLKKARAKHANRYLEMLIKSLHVLTKELPELSFGLECRNYPYELPNAEELAILLNEFRNKNNLGYWHDCGHAFLQESLGFYTQKEILDIAGNRILGFHLHDVTDRDHKTPGTGRIPWDLLDPYIVKASLLVLELAPDLKYRDIEQGYRFMQKLLKRFKERHIS